MLKTQSETLLKITIAWNGEGEINSVITQEETDPIPNVPGIIS